MCVMAVLFGRVGPHWREVDCGALGLEGHPLGLRCNKSYCRLSQRALLAIFPCHFEITVLFKQWGRIRLPPFLLSGILERSSPKDAGTERWLSVYSEHFILFMVRLSVLRLSPYLSLNFLRLLGWLHTWSPVSVSDMLETELAFFALLKLRNPSIYVSVGCIYRHLPY